MKLNHVIPNFFQRDEIIAYFGQARLVKRLDAKIAANLERRQIGEQFKLLDPARIPERAIGPDRSTVNVAGAGLGLGLGCFAIVARRKKRVPPEHQPGDPTPPPVAA